MQPLSGKNENILCILWLVPGRGGAKECYPAAIPLTKPTTTDSNSNQLQRTPTTTTATFTPPPPPPSFSHIHNCTSKCPISFLPLPNSSSTPPVHHPPSHPPPPPPPHPPHALRAPRPGIIHRLPPRPRPTEPTN